MINMSGRGACGGVAGTTTLVDTLPTSADSSSEAKKHNQTTANHDEKD
jgi:hypothetical protein